MNNKKNWINENLTDLSDELPHARRALSLAGLALDVGLLRRVGRLIRRRRHGRADGLERGVLLQVGLRGVLRQQLQVFLREEEEGGEMSGHGKISKYDVYK